MWQGALSTRTRILVTHQLQYLPQCDRIVVLDGGRVLHTGTFAELESSGVEWQRLVKPADSETAMIPAATAASGKPDRVVAPVSPRKSLSTAVTPVSPAVRDILLEMATPAMRLEAKSVAAQPSMRYVAQPDKIQPDGSPRKGDVIARQPSRAGGRLMTLEYRVEGAVSSGTLSRYCQVPACFCFAKIYACQTHREQCLTGCLNVWLQFAGGYVASAFAVSLVFVSVVARVAPDYWLSYWVSSRLLTILRSL